MSAEPRAVLTSISGQPIPLQGVTAHGQLTGLLFELTVEQRYRNAGKDNIEAVFTFPLPARAVLLGMDLEIGDRRLSGIAIGRQEASERYEQAIDDGDAAALLEHQGNGLYTVNLGNLLPGQAAVIRYRYAELLDAHEGYVRLNVPTVIAPRYGDPTDSGLDGPSIPGVDLFGEYPFSIVLNLIGITDGNAVRSPSHPVMASIGEGGLTVSLAKNGFLDRDFVLELDAASVPKHSLIARDGDGYTMLTSATVASDAQEKRPLVLKVLLDCSGSMGGDSIAAAKRALINILNRLDSSDLVSFTRFGSSVQQVSHGLERASLTTIEALKATVRHTDADLGGTNLRVALKASLEIPTPPESTVDLILITDGEVYDVQKTVEVAAQSGHRLFAIAIGAAPNEALARMLSEKTGGWCEFVGPTEDAEGAILRTFKRLRATPRYLERIDWPTTPVWTAPLPTSVFPGGTVHLFAGFKDRPEAETVLHIGDSEGRTTATHVATASRLSTSDLIPRLGAARRLATLSDTEARDLAVQYQLATQHTSFVVVAERAEAEKAASLPRTAAIPHMLAAGWGGTSKPDMAASSMERAAPRACESRAVGLPRFDTDRLHGLIAPVDRHRDANRSPARSFENLIYPVVVFEQADRYELVRSLHDAFQNRSDIPRSFREFYARHPVPDAVQSLLREACAECAADEEKVIEAFLAWLGEHSDTTGVSWEFKAMLRGTVVGRRGFRQLRGFMNRSFEP